MSKVWREACDETEEAIYCLTRDAKLLSCAPSQIIEHNREWIEEARDFLSEALERAGKVREAA
jgi:hypothetical protein